MLRVLELFGGIGACTEALKNIGVDFKVVDYVEVDKYAVKSYNAMNGTSYEPQDIRDWDKDITADLIMHGSPCQDFSVSGKNRGGDEGSGTRSSLMYETIRIVEKLRPKYVIWENVKNLLSKKHRHNFDAYLERMEALGYTNYWKVLNSKDYGVPQNRERVFTISILGGSMAHREDGQITFDDLLGYDKGQSFNFPPKEELTIKLADLLQENVSEKYYLPKKILDIMCVSDAQTDGTFIPIKNATSKGYLEAYEGDGVDIQFPKSQTRRGRVQRQKAHTLTCCEGEVAVVLGGLRIRKLTPREYWRLQSFSEKSYDQAKSVCSDFQLYRQAGNSITVRVLEKILTNLLTEINNNE